MSAQSLNGPVSRTFDKGTVWLVGAGPGDPGLLTVMAVEALRQADVIVYDALVLAQVLELAAPGTPVEFAGKRAGKPSASQHEITQRLIELAREDKRVLRLKGGDPFVFGRGAEEARALAEAKIRFRIVPGITAGIGGLAYAGIPATMRNANPGLFFATGHPASDGEDRVDWEAVARVGQPVVIYMGMTRLKQIAARLLAGGLPRNTPLAIVSSATLPQQDVLETTLGDADEVVNSRSTGAPAIIVIGSIIGLRSTLLPYQIC